MYGMSVVQAGYESSSSGFLFFFLVCERMVCMQCARRVRGGFELNTRVVRAGCKPGSSWVRAGYENGSCMVRAGYKQGRACFVLFFFRCAWRRCT